VAVPCIIDASTAPTGLSEHPRRTTTDRALIAGAFAGRVAHPTAGPLPLCHPRKSSGLTRILPRHRRRIGADAADRRVFPGRRHNSIRGGRPPSRGEVAVYVHTPSNRPPLHQAHRRSWKATASPSRRAAPSSTAHGGRGALRQRRRPDAAFANMAEIRVAARTRVRCGDIAQQAWNSRDSVAHGPVP